MQSELFNKVFFNQNLVEKQQNLVCITTIVFTLYRSTYCAITYLQKQVLGIFPAGFSPRSFLLGFSLMGVFPGSLCPARSFLRRFFPR